MYDASDSQAKLARLLGNAHAVLFDFDGPITDLFRGMTTAPVADEIKKTVRLHWGELDQDVEDCEDSHGILLRLRDMADRPTAAHRSRYALDLAEARVTRHEYDIVRSARPVPHLDTVLDALLGLGLRLAIVSNNAEGPIREFLNAYDLQSGFDVIVGRDPKELHHMKPSPESVERAVRQLGLSPAGCVLFGDQLTDLAAAVAAGTRFLGFTGSPARSAEMTRRGADHVVSSLVPLLSAARRLSQPE
ncbi:hydrolase [Streptomyces tendae]|uniref:HAD family hydrolase n=1 Tax=Streptomyces tendae TaxID=1932 RepID=UPI001674FA08|nr:HAD family phosphatase [Streptomyces tendae]GHB09657.1 hydrolase [Streptomyces tendae]